MEQMSMTGSGNVTWGRKSGISALKNISDSKIKKKQKCYYEIFWALKSKLLGLKEIGVLNRKWMLWTFMGFELKNFGTKRSWGIR